MEVSPGASRKWDVALRRGRKDRRNSEQWLAWGQSSQDHACRESSVAETFRGSGRKGQKAIPDTASASVCLTDSFPPQLSEPLPCWKCISHSLGGPCMTKPCICHSRDHGTRAPSSQGGRRQPG